ncbi:MAG: cytochrome P450 [Myxococcota bacterium]|nr:cytochrome P450 [Myxococcota bacterium]
MNLADVDLYDLDSWAERVLHDELTLLRNQEPIFRHEMPNGRPFWAITKADHIAEMSKNPQDFSSWRGGTTLDDYADEDLFPIRQLMLNMDPPQHSKFRKLVSRGFTPRMVRLMETRIRDDIDEIMDRILPLGEIDFVREVAAELPLRVICRLVGIPDSDFQLIFDWTNRLIGFDDPEVQTSIDDSRIAAMELWQYAQELVEGRGGRRADDLIHVLLNAEVDGEAITEAEFNAFFLLLSVAGNETTRNAISSGLLAMLEHPDQWQRLVDDPSLAGSATEEILRWSTPVIYMRRTCTRDLNFHGVEMKENDKIALFYTSANRDEARFEDPFRFDITRSPNEHLAFGVGEHFCLGSSLARLEIRLLFEAMAERMTSIEQAGDVRRLRSNFIAGIKTLPIRFTERAR